MVTDAAVATVQLQQATATSTVTQAGQVDDRHRFQNPDIYSGPDRVLGAPPHPALPAPMDLQPEVAEIDFTAFTRLAPSGHRDGWWCVASPTFIPSRGTAEHVVRQLAATGADGAGDAVGQQPWDGSPSTVLVGAGSTVHRFMRPLRATPPHHTANPVAPRASGGSPSG
ncbi:MAG: hypothetical protein EOP24_46090 [Hyphomicrobiales bacterium]|nr:MAG: hypothetical protein EOP24_46090 [Hyphomicrobiales bacterium]